MIVYPRNTVTYFRNNQAVSWPGFEPATASHKSSVLTITPPIDRGFKVIKHNYVYKVAPEVIYNINKVTRGNDYRLSENRCHYTVNLAGTGDRSEYDIESYWIEKLNCSSSVSRMIRTVTQRLSLEPASVNIIDLT